MKHSPLPFQAGEFAVDHRLRAIAKIRDNDGEPILVAPPHIAQAKWEADARYIVLACNHFEEAVEALKKARLFMLQNNDHEDYTIRTLNDISVILSRIEEADHDK